MFDTERDDDAVFANEAYLNETVQDSLQRYDISLSIEDKNVKFCVKKLRR